jgi:hypothetical protein
MTGRVADLAGSLSFEHHVLGGLDCRGDQHGQSRFASGESDELTRNFAPSNDSSTIGDATTSSSHSCGFLMRRHGSGRVPGVAAVVFVAPSVPASGLISA